MTTTYAAMRQDEAAVLAQLAHQLVSARDAWWDDAPWQRALDDHITFWSDVEDTCARDGGLFPEELKADLVNLAGEVIGLCQALKAERNPEVCDAVLRIDVEMAEGLLGLSKAAAEADGDAAPAHLGG